MARTIVFGDIHGAARALEQVVERAEICADDKLIFLGDYVDGWSQSADVIDCLIALDRTNSCIFLRGNHDAWCEAWMKEGTPDPVWIPNGGRTTMESYGGVADAKKEEHARFMGRFRNYYVDDSNRLFVHAGFSSLHGPDMEPFQSNLYWDRTLWEMAVAADPRLSPQSRLYPKRLRHFREIFIGHTPTLNFGSSVPMHCCNVWNVDTGAGFTGRLTALDADTKEFIQSDPVTSLYPAEKGRNR